MGKKELKASLIALSFMLSGCNITNHDNLNENEVKIETEYNDDSNDLEETIVYEDDKVIDSSISDVKEEVITLKKSLKDLVQYDMVVAKDDVYIRDMPVDGNILGTLPNGYSLQCTGVADDNWYIVAYYGNESYVSGDYVDLTKGNMFPYYYEKLVYLPNEAKMYIDDEFKEQVDLNQYEVLEVYDTQDDKYLVKTNEYFGYIDICNTLDLPLETVVVDLSDQELKFYENNQVILDVPVVTGKPSTPTYTGYFNVSEKLYDATLLGGVVSDCFFRFDGGRGFHDAEYHGNRGWRETKEFGGNTYLTNGSHGCVNMRIDDVKELDELVEVGTKVIVKK